LIHRPGSSRIEDKTKGGAAKERKTIEDEIHRAIREAISQRSGRVIGK